MFNIHEYIFYILSRHGFKDHSVNLIAFVNLIAVGTVNFIIWVLHLRHFNPYTIVTGDDIRILLTNVF